MATNGILVPVSLYIENLLKIINDLKGQLGNLKVGSSGFKAMENHIRALQKELDKFLILASKPFLTENLFIAAEKSVDKLEDEIERVSLTASRLKFSDLELNGELKALLKAVEDLINAIKASFKTLKDTAKLSFLDTDLGLLWTKLHPEDTSRSLDLITNSIRRAVKELSDTVKEAESVVEGYKRAITMGDAVKAMNKTHGKGQDPDALKALMGNEFSTFFKELKNGKIQFLDGQLGFFTAWLAKNFELDESVIKDLLKASGPRIAALLNDANSSIRLALNGAVVKADSARILLPSAKLDATEQDAKLKELTAILNVATGATDSMKISEELLREALTAAGITLENTKEGIAADVRARQEWRNVNQLGTAELNNLRTALLQTNAQFLQQLRVTLNFNSMKMAVVNFMGFRQVLNLTRTAIREAINHIKELDSVMNKISIVTNMSTSDLWAQVDAYSKMAQLYGTTIKGAYEVSLIYYQQGLETKDVLTLTNETLKLAKVSGLDYAQTTDYMTTALRGFKMEMSEASKVVDVYSNLAAHTAVSSEELAVAMSKTASSMESVGSTFEETSAMIGTMVAVTRESATNIGSALKSIASRYGEMKQDPLKLVDSEGDEISYNKVDAALQSVGISMKTVDGQFRSFTEVIIELSEKWDQLESTQQRYIATLFAGNRQQSRFLALVSNPELLKANLGYAEESEDTGTLQALKALDSIESKLNLVLVAYQQFYTTLGVENVWKGLLDGTTNVINTLNSLPKLFNKIPLGAIAAISNVITLIKGLLTRGIQGVAALWSGALKNSGSEATTLGNTIGKNLMLSIETLIKAGTPAVLAALNAALSLQLNNANNQVIPLNDRLQLLFNIGTNNNGYKNYAKLAENYVQNNMMTLATYDSAVKLAAAGNENAYKEAIERANNAIRTLNGLLRENTNEINNNNAGTLSKIGFFDKLKDGNSKLNRGLSATAMALTTVGMVLDKSSTAGRIASGVFTGLGGALLTGTAAARVFAGDWSALPLLVMGVINIVNGFGIAIESPAERLERLKQEAEELNNEAKKAKSEYRTLDNSIKKLDELKEKRYESAEAAEEYLTAVDELAATYPSLIKSFDSMGNVILDASTMENTLTEARLKAAEAAYTAAKAEAARAKLELLVKDNSLDARIGNINSFILGAWTKTVALAPREDGKYDSIGARGTGDRLFNILIENLSSLNDTEQELLAYINRRKEEGKGIGSGEILTGLLLDIAANASLENYAEALNYIRLMRSAYEATGWKMPEEVEKLLTNITESMQEVIPLVDTIDAANKLMVNSWLRSSKYSEISFVSSNSGLSSLFLSLLYELANGDYSEAHLEKLAYELLQGPMQFWESLNEDEQALFDKMFSDTKNYTKNDFKLLFGEKAFFPAIENLLETYYNPDIVAILKRANASLAQAMGKKADVNGNFEAITYNTEGITTALKKLLWIASNNLTLTEEKFYNNVLSLYESLTKKGYNTRADAFAMASADLYGLIDKAPAEIEALLWNIINENGLTTLEGILKVRDQIAANSNLLGYISDNTLDILYKNIIPNISLAIQTATSDLLDNWEDTSKELSKAMSGGVTLKEANELINKAKSLGVEIDLSSFLLEGDKLILTAESFREYYNKLTEANKQASEEWQSRITRAGLLLAGAGIHNWKYTENDRALLESLGFDITDSKYYTDGNLTNEGIEALSKAIKENLEGVDNYNKAALIAADLLLNSYNRSLGIYQLSVDGPVLLVELLEKIAQGLNLNGEKLGKNDTSARAIKESINSVYNTLISDVLSEGFDNINLDDYEGLIANEKGERIPIELSGSYKEFVYEYAALAGLTIDETNDLLLLAIEKDRETKAEDLIKDLTFLNKDTFRTSRSDLNKIANAFDKPIEELITASGAVFDEITQEYIIDILKLADAGIDLTQVDNFRVTVQESIESLFDGLASNIKNALGGSLDSKGTKNLADTLKQIGINTKLSFIRTKEGYKLSTDLVEKLYEELKTVDALTALIVLDELNKSIDESIIGAKNLNKEIAALRATTESDDFKFMSGNIPSGQNNPLNYFENWGKAWKTLLDSFKGSGKDKGKIDYKDFYNIMSEMGRIAAESGEPILIGANKFITDAESAAALIEEGAAALTVAQDGSVKVDLTQLGIDFAAGGKDMLKGVDTGIKAVAKALIKILDAEIAMLEAIVAMQDLNIAGEDNKVDISDIFNFDNEGKLQEKVTTLLTFLNTSIAEFSIGGLSLNEVLFSRLNPQELVDFFNELNTIITDPNCDPETIRAQITSLILKFFPEDTVEVNDAIFGMLNFDKETLGSDLYNKIIKLLDDKLTLNEASKLGVISEIKEKNKELGTLLETLLKLNGDISFATALKIAAEITLNGTITKKDGTWSYTYDGVTHDGYATEALAKAAMKKEITDKYKNTDYSSVISADGSSQNEITVLKNGTVVNKRTLSNGGTVYMVGDTPLTWDGSDQSLIDALDKSSIGENGDITFKDTKGRTITITSSGTVGYTCTVDDTTNTTIYTRNGKTLKCTTGSVKLTELDEFFAGERTFVDTISIDDEGNETPITLVRSVSGIEYDTSFDPTTRKYTINGLYASDTPEAAAKAYEAANPPTTQTTTEEDKGIKTFTWHYNGVAIEITYDEKTKTYSVNGTPIVGATTPDEAISLANLSGIILLEDLHATLDVYVKLNIKTEEDEYDKLKRFLHGQKGHLSLDTVNEFGAEFGLTKTGDNYNVESDKLFANYINSLYEKAVNLKLVLTKTEQEIIGILKDTKGLYGHIDDDYYKKIEEISKANDYNLDNITTPLTELNLLFASDNITSLNDALNSLLTTLSLLENVNLTSVVQTINDIQAITGNEGEGELTLNIKFTDDQKEAISNKIDELILKIITPQTMPIIPDIDEEVIKNYTPPTKIMYIRLKILEAGGASGNISRKETNLAHYVLATGNVGNANAKGTLMGELGPELVVSNGRYFVAGLNGAEFVNLDTDAIVFNHLQTKSLLEKGMSSSRGKALTSEKAAIAYAKGSIHGGPAKADATATLAALKQLRAQWKALANMSAKDLAGKGGGGGGGGKDVNFIKDLERWYNWLQEIAKLEKKINYEESLRSKMLSDFNRNGKDYYNSLKDTLEYLEREKLILQDLVKELTAFFNKRRNELNAQSAFSELYTFDEEGQIKYKTDKFELLTEMFGNDSVTGKANHSVQEQYDYLISQGYGYAMQYKDDGSEIKVKNAKDTENMVTAIEAFWSKIDVDLNEMLNLYDSIEEGLKSILEHTQKQNEILHLIEDNLISVENRVLKALEDSIKREIDELSKQKDAIEKSSTALIDGLSKSLEKERSMYLNQLNKSDLESKRRLLAILLRSGGSAAEIRSLQDQINSASQEEYFNKQQEQIDALQEASDTQIEKMQEQIDIMNESLEYQKEHGLLWERVYEVMNLSPKDIADYIQKNDSEYWGQSPTDLGKNMRDVLFEAELYKAYAENGVEVKDLVTLIADEIVEERKIEKEKQQAALTETTTSTTTSSSSNNNNNSKSKTSNKDKSKEKWEWNGKTYNSEKEALDARYAAALKALNDGMSLQGVSDYGYTMAKRQYNLIIAMKPKKIETKEFGGMVEHTGMELVHAKEGVLTPEQTSILRNEILGNDRNSLLNLLQDFRATYGNIANNSTYNTSSEATIIEHAEVNMHVGQLANSYDSARAADDVMKEMLNIARKTNAQNRIGR